MIAKNALCGLVVATMASCGPSTPKGPVTLQDGPWMVRMDLAPEAYLPFGIDLSTSPDSSLHITIHNGEERIAVDQVERRGDSLFVRMPLFDSEFKARIVDGTTLEGQWYDLQREAGYAIPFTAKAGDGPRFARNTPASAQVDGTWEVHFSPGTESSYPAIGLFQRHSDGRATGTFLTETGDYRYLEGAVVGDSLLLSAFDGSHAFLFQAVLRGDSLHGVFRSGNHWQEPWTGVRNEQFQLKDPDSITAIREGRDMIDFRFPDTDGHLVTPNDARFKGKVLVVQIMGSWCPNCVDETRLLNELYARHKDNGLEVLSVAFERPEDVEKALGGLQRFKRVLGVEYPILFGGRSNKGESSEKLPFLNKVIGYPTCILIDRKGKVRKIRTGIYGPSSPVHYAQYKKSFEDFLVQLMGE